MAYLVFTNFRHLKVNLDTNQGVFLPSFFFGGGGWVGVGGNETSPKFLVPLINH